MTSAAGAEPRLRGEGSASERSSEAPQAASLRAANITVRYGARAVLRAVSLTAHAGDVVGILGPSGAGKSTLFGVLAGESLANVTEHEGTVTLRGEDVTALATHLRVQRGLGYVPQLPSVLFDLTARDNLITFLELSGRNANAPDHGANALLARVALGDRGSVRAGSLSGGERRRLELARALVTEPRVLLCDEPFAGIDPSAAKMLGALLADFAASGGTVLLADHHVNEALAICTRALLLLDGEIHVDAAPDAFRAHALVQGRYLGTLAPEAQ